MRSKYLIILFLLFYHFSPAQNTVLWKISQPGNSHVSYLLGTYHLTGPAFIDSLPVVADKIASSDLVVTETLIDAEAAKTYYGSRPHSDTLSQLLSKEDIQTLQEALNNKYDVFKLSPGELYVFLTVAYQRRICQPGIKDSLPADLYIQKLASKNNKEQFYLEKNQLDILRQSSASISWNVFKRQAPGLLDSYRANKYNANACLAAIQYASLSPEYNFKQTCPAAFPLQGRNDSWIQEITPLLTGKSCFIAVGYQHLMYKCGLIQQLIKAGYSVEPVAMK